MVNYLFRRFLYIIPTIWGIATLIFFLMFAIPGDPVRLMLGHHGDEEIRQRITREMGLDQPMLVQYGMFLGRLLHGDLGNSYHQDRPVIDILLERLPATMLLAAAAMILSIIFGLAAGIVSAIRQNKLTDIFVMAGSLIGISTPVFWLGLLLILVFAAKTFYGTPVVFGILPVSGYGEWGMDRIKHLVLPALSLSAIGMGYIARMTRSSVLEVIRQDYVRTAKSKGLSYRVVVLKHVLRNALIPVVTVIGIDFAALLGGAVATETVFAWPGLGKIIVDSIRQLDGPVVEGGVMFMALMFVIVNTLVDITYVLIDPRIRLD
ncbi:ABC transporter permease [bacterium]|nr:ABC transporter permease [candidate division CSSED10-310 bacterium]